MKRAFLLTHFNVHNGYSHAFSVFLLFGALTALVSEATAGSGRYESRRTEQQAWEIVTMDPKVTADDLEEIRDAVITYYETAKPEFWRSFVAELKRGAINKLNDSLAIGIWQLQSANNGIALVRQPPISPEMHYFGINLAKQNGKWTVLSQFHEKERLDLR
jgi:hypothetical protein